MVQTRQIESNLKVLENTDNIKLMMVIFVLYDLINIKSQ